MCMCIPVVELGLEIDARHAYLIYMARDVASIQVYIIAVTVARPSLAFCLISQCTFQSISIISNLPMEPKIPSLDDDAPVCE